MKPYYLAIVKPAIVSVPRKLTKWAAPPIDADWKIAVSMIVQCLSPYVVEENKVESETYSQTISPKLRPLVAWPILQPVGNKWWNQE